MQMTTNRSYIVGLGLACLVTFPDLPRGGVQAQEARKSERPVASAPEAEWKQYYQGDEFSPAKVASLEDHGVFHRKVSAEEMRFIATFPNLKRLTLGDAPEGVEISREALQVVGEIAGLELLHLCKEELRDEDLAFLLKLRKLKALRIQASDMIDPNDPHGLTDRAAGVLARLPLLEELEIYGKGPYSDEFFRAILSLPKLRILDFTSASATDETLRLAAKKESLIKVDATSPKFTEDGIKALRESKSLKQIEVSTE